MGKLLSSAFRIKLIAHVNTHQWWHIPLNHQASYFQRGMCFSSTFEDAELNGTPLDTPFRVTVLKPLIGDEAYIETKLLGAQFKYPGDTYDELFNSPESIAAIDAHLRNLHDIGLKKGYDSLIILQAEDWAQLQATGKVPSWLELNVLHPDADSVRVVAQKPEEKPEEAKYIM
jgi:hypothetical protein